MKIIIAGGRDFKDYDYLFGIMDYYLEKGSITEIVSGKQKTRNPMGGVSWGADYIGELWAIENNIPIKSFPANWNALGLAAGHLRNAEMADYANGLVAFWDGKSKGTKNMISQMRKRNKSNIVHRYEN